MGVAVDDGGGSGQGTATRLIGPLSWNAFRTSVKGQGLSKEEIGRQYREQRTHGG